ERIKEYVIAIEVFEKPEDYDPQADSTVRTEASKLRSRLARYYDTEGREDKFVIAIPKGSYVPKFEHRSNGVLVTSPDNPPAPAPLPCRAPILVWSALATLVLAGLTVAGAFVWRSRTSPLPLPRLIPITSYPELEEQPNLSPDGSQVAFRWKGDIREVG